MDKAYNKNSAQSGKIGFKLAFKPNTKLNLPKDEKDADLAAQSNKVVNPKSEVGERKRAKKAETQPKRKKKKADDQKRDYIAVIRKINDFNPDLVAKITKKTLDDIDKSPSLLPLAQKFFADPESFRHIDILLPDPNSPLPPHPTPPHTAPHGPLLSPFFRADVPPSPGPSRPFVIVENIPDYATAQQIGDFFNASLQKICGEPRQMVADVVSTAQIGAARVFLCAEKHVAAAAALNGAFFGPNQLVVKAPFAAQFDFGSGPPGPGFSAGIGSGFGTGAVAKGSQWDQKTPGGTVDWRERRDEIMRNSLPEDNSDGFPVVVSNIAGPEQFREVGRYLTRLVDEKTPNEIEFFKNAYQLSENTIILMARTKEVFEIVLDLKGTASFDNRRLTIRPFIDDGSIKISKLKLVHIV